MIAGCISVRNFLFRPSSSPFLSGDTFRRSAAVRFDDDRDIEVKVSRIRDGQVVFCKSDYLMALFSGLRKGYSRRFVLLSGNSDVNVDASLATALPDTVTHWFAQNLIVDSGPRITPLPIGLENLHYRNHGYIPDFRALHKQVSSPEPKVLYSFNVATNPKERNLALASLSQCRVAKHERASTSHEYRRLLCRSAFVASPPGNGHDCHRTWEAMYLGCIPILKRSPLSTYFRSLGLPLLDVASWSEIEEWSEDDLTAIRQDVLLRSNTEALWFDYWKERIIERSFG